MKGAGMTEGVASPGWPVDAHVHLHRLEDVPKTLDAACANFRRLAPVDHGLTGGLLLTQMSRERVFEALSSLSSAGAWRLEQPGGEPESLIATRGHARVALICGRQVRADDGLEVVAYGSIRTFVDGRPFDECLQEVLESGAIAAIPWGFGKWTGRRGRLVRAAIARPEHAGIFLGDSGSRNAALPEPPLIREGRAAGLRVLPGTDPFPFGGDYHRVGTFGFLADIQPEAGSRPWQALRSWLERQPTSPQAYGQPSGPFRFVLNQFGMQAYNRLPGRSA